MYLYNGLMMTHTCGRNWMPGKKHPQKTGLCVKTSLVNTYRTGTRANSMCMGWRCLWCMFAWCTSRVLPSWGTGCFSNTCLHMLWHFTQMNGIYIQIVNVYLII